MATKNRNAFCLDSTEQYIFSGNKGGELEVIKIDDFKVLSTVQAHYGSIETVTSHASYPYVAVLGKDHHVTIWKYEKDGKITLLHNISTRSLSPGDFVKTFQSTTQALSFHRTKNRLAGHSGNAGLFEIEFCEKKFEILHCSRIDEKLDFITAQYVEESDRILTATNRGLVALSENGEILRTWDFGKNNLYQAIHWFEPIAPDIFLIASDGQRVIRLDISGRTKNIEGPFIARDHLEHVTYNPVSRKAYCASFDRNIYEVDVNTCDSLGTVWKAPFKCRWIKTLKRDPNVLLVNCRNGGLYKIDLETKKSVDCLKETLPAIWTGIVRDKELLFAGEGNRLVQLQQSGESRWNRVKKFNENLISFDADPNFYAKRIVAIGDNQFALGRTNGDILLFEKDTLKQSIRLPDAVRDLVFDNKRHCLYVACENGMVYQCSVVGDSCVKPIYQNDSPVWALGLHPHGDLLAIGSRFAHVHLFNLNQYKVRGQVAGNRFIKRVRWCDENRLLIGGDNIRRYNLKEDTVSYLFRGLSNTVEDFDWDLAQRYLVAIAYTREIYLFDFETGQLLATHGDGVDYSKGIFFLNREKRDGGYPGDFVVFGRAGCPYYCRIHDERILSYGPIASVDQL